MKKGLFTLLFFSVLIANAQKKTEIKTTGTTKDALILREPIDPIGDILYFKDNDGDSYGDSSGTPVSTLLPGYVTNNWDCNDFNANINPTTVWYYDNDGDGYGSTVVKEVSCLQPIGSSLLNTDCNDADPNITTQTVLWYFDTDGDGFGDATATGISSCTAPTSQYVTNNTDLCPIAYDTIDGCPTSVVENMNWIISKAFDITGATIANSKTYFDELGKGIQSQSVDIKTGHTWASQTLYDAQGRPALQSLSAPINSTGEFLYNPDFIKKTDGTTTYAIVDFETTLENPEPVGDTVNTLGWYYSENNTNEPYQDITSYPFSRTIYSDLNPGTALKVIGGNKIDTNGDGIGDSWKSGYTFSMPASQELSNSLAFNDIKYNNIKTVKRINRNIHGVETVVFSDTDGKTLAVARSGGATQSSSHSIGISEQGFVDIHIPDGIIGFTMTIPAGITTEVYDLITEQVITTATTDLSNGFYRIVITNLDSYDAVNSPVTISYSENYYGYSLNKYNKKGQLTASYQPLNHLETTFDYNVLGQLIYTKSPDEGEAWFKYRKDGQIRFSQNSKQVLEGVFSYTNYDDLGRPIESGVIINNSFATVDPDATLPIGAKTEQHFTVYDNQEIPVDQSLPIKTFNQALADLGLTTEYQSAFLASNVAITYTKEPETTTTWYSYDIYGRVNWIVQYINGLGTKTIDYEYDPITSAVTKVDFQRYKTDERFVHKYSYNVVGELIKVETSTDDVTFITHADYQYNETGALKRVEIAEGLQGIDYVYNLAGQLKAINHPELTSGKDPNGDINDLFGMHLNYYAGDYLRANTYISSPSEGINQYNGNIKSVTWNTSGLGTSTPDTYYYKYNKNNWLEGASFNSSISEGSEGVNIADFEQTWIWQEFVLGTPQGGGDTVILTAVNNTVSFTYFASFQDSYIKTGPVVQINYAVPDMDLGYFRVTRSTGEIITDQFKVSISNGWIVINPDDPYYNNVTYEGMQNLDNTLAVSQGSVSQDITTTGDYNVFDITYDANGNIQTLNRNKNTENASNVMDKLTYKYDASKPNQLNQVIDTEGDVGVNDIGSQQQDNYIYNSIGQLTKNVGEGVEYFYNASGLVTEIQKNNIPLVKFFYNDKGQRVRKESYIGTFLDKTEYYVRDAAGSVLAIYNGPTQKELPIYGATRLGIYFKTSNTSVYQLTDHLGNVRAVIAKDEQNNAVASTATDYYPGGMTMPNRNLTGSELYRHGYQGEFAEKDVETGLNAFKLRMYDSRINRWISPDPYGQYFSPYMSMSNNWTNVVDPDGGCDNGKGQLIRCPDDGTGIPYQLNEITITGKGSGFSGIAGVRFEQWKQIIQPDITKRKAEWKGAYAMALSPFLVIGGLEVSPSYLISTDFWIGKSVISAVSQYTINRQINFVGVVSDAVLIPAVSDFVGSSFELGINNEGFYSYSILDSKPINAALREGAISTVFSLKLHGLDKFTKAGVPAKILYHLPNQFANYGAQSK